jgi:hypothetical protein
VDDPGRNSRHNYIGWHILKNDSIRCYHSSVTDGDGSEDAGASPNCHIVSQSRLASVGIPVTQGDVLVQR